VAKVTSTICFCQNGHRFTDIPIQFNDTTWSSVRRCDQFMITSATVECYSQDSVNSRHDSNPSDGNGASGTHLCFEQHGTARTELEVASPDTGDSSTRLSAADAWSSVHRQLKLYQQRQMIWRNLRMRTAVKMVLLKPRPIWRAKNAKWSHEISSIENVVDNASEVKPA